MAQLQRGGEEAKDATSSLPPPDTPAGLPYGYEPSYDETEEITHRGGTKKGQPRRNGKATPRRNVIHTPAL